jgi:murein DD-endopeptidase MepM/ murein hydrolase activator NlpD
MRAILVAAVFALPSQAIAGSGVLIKPTPDLGAMPALAVARLTGALQVRIVPEPMIDELVRWETGARDLVHDALDQLVALANDIPAPDLTILTTDPIPNLTTGESSGFGWRNDPIRHDTRWHSGTDFRAKPGTPVMAAGDGVVVIAGWQGGYGNVVYVDHGGGVTTRYAHLRKILVKKDAAITAGQPVGEVGSTGRTTGPHLHFEVRLDGRPVSPILAMSVGDLQRNQPDIARLAVFSLRPELQANAQATVDAPTGSKKADARPERAGHKRQDKPLW